MLKFFFLLLFLFSSQTKADSIEGGDWIVTDFVGEAVFIKPDEIIGQKQKFYDGIEGIFLNCKWGSVWTYKIYNSLDELISNKEFELMGEHKDHLNLQEDIYYVHRLSCSGEREGDIMMNLYPFITTENPDTQKAYFIFEMGVFELEIKDKQ